jgi:hypothetical protein
MLFPLGIVRLKTFSVYMFKHAICLELMLFLASSEPLEFALRYQNAPSELLVPPILGGLSALVTMVARRPSVVVRCIIRRS